MRFLWSSVNQSLPQCQTFLQWLVTLLHRVQLRIRTKLPHPPSASLCGAVSRWLPPSAPSPSESVPTSISVWIITCWRFVFAHDNQPSLFPPPFLRSMPTRTTWTRWRSPTARPSCSFLAATTLCARCGTDGRCERTGRSPSDNWPATETASPSSTARWVALLVRRPKASKKLSCFWCSAYAPQLLVAFCVSGRRSLSH